ncbi:Hypothetical protein, putative, partial [Bodo saltans]
TFPKFLRLTWPNQAAYEAFDISAIPTLLVFSPDGNLMTAKGVQALLKDPEGSEFPYGDMWSGLTPMNQTDLAMWEHASQTLAHAALKRYTPDPSLSLVVSSSATSPPSAPPSSVPKEWQLSDVLFEKVHRLLESTLELVSVLPQQAGAGSEERTVATTATTSDVTTALTHLVKQSLPPLLVDTTSAARRCRWWCR